MFTTLKECYAPEGIQKQILQDGVVTDAEYAEARERFERCVSDLGYNIRLNPEGSVMIEYDDDTRETRELTLSAVDTCDHENKYFIEALYWDMQSNPENLPLEALIIDCLNEHGLNPDNITGQQLSDLLDEQPDAWPEDFFDAGDPQVDACVYDQ